MFSSRAKLERACFTKKVPLNNQKNVLFPVCAVHVVQECGVLQVPGIIETFVRDRRNCNVGLAALLLLA